MNIKLIFWQQVKDKSRNDDKPPYFEMQCLRIRSIQILVLSTAVFSAGLYAPLFFLVSWIDFYFFTWTLLFLYQRKDFTLDKLDRLSNFSAVRTTFLFGKLDRLSNFSAVRTTFLFGKLDRLSNF